MYDSINIYNTSYFGLFWLTDTPDFRIYGNLSIDSSGIAKLLITDSIIKGVKTRSYEFIQDIAVVQGLVIETITLQNYSIKLYDVYQIRQLNARLNATVLQSEKILIGKAVQPDNNVLYNTLMVTSEQWMDWVNLKGMDFKLGYEGNDDVLITAKQKKIKPITLLKNSQYHIYIYTRQTYNLSRNKPLNIGNVPYLNIEFGVSKELKEVVAFKLSLERFFSAYLEEYVYFTHADVRTEIETYFEMRINEDVRHPRQMKRSIDTHVFTRNSKDYFVNWFRIYDELHEAITTFYYAFESRKMDIHNKFLNYVFALEQYHRKRIKDRRPLIAKDENMSRKVLQELKGDMASWVRKQLSVDRDIPISERLNELYSSLINKEEVELTPELIKRIKNTRHYLVHLDAKLKSDCFTTTELFHVNDLLTQLFLRLLKQEVVTNVTHV